MTGPNAARPPAPRVSGASRALPGAAPPAAEPSADVSGPRLECTAGPAAGSVFPLTDDENVIGRATGLAVHVLDPSLSRKHALVRRTDEGWALSDLGSGNGTQLNGEALEGEVPLKAGDSIAAGDTVLTFVEGAEAAEAARGEGSADVVELASDTAEGLPAAGPKPRRRPPVRTSRALGTSAPAQRRERSVVTPAAVRQRSRRVRLIGAGAVLVLALALALAWRVKQVREEEDFKRALAVDQARVAEYQGKRQAATDDLRKGLWDGARRRFEELEATQVELLVLAFPPRPESRKLLEELTEAKRLVADSLANLAKEQPNLERLAEAQRSVNRGDWLAASKALEAISTANHQLRERKQGLTRQVDEGLQAKLAEAQALLRSAGADRSKLEQVKRTAEEVLAVRPELREALALRREAEDALARLIGGGPPPPPPAGDPVENVRSLYRSGDVGGALVAARACAAKSPGCRRLLEQLSEFDARLRAANGGGDAEVLALFELDRKISGSTGLSGALPKALRQKAAVAFYKKAAAAATAVNWRRAVEAAQACLGAEPGHVGCTQVLEKARAECKNVYMRGYVLKDSQPDEAAKLVREVMAMCSSSDEWHEKARIRLDELKP